jgi:hypothetical protein
MNALPHSTSFLGQVQRYFHVTSPPHAIVHIYKRGGPLAVKTQAATD